MTRKPSLLIREICWVVMTMLLYGMTGWMLWEIWLATFTPLGSVLRLAPMVMAIGLLFWARRRLNRLVAGPLYRHAMQAYMIGEMRHT